MRTEHLSYLLTVLECGSISEASRQLNISHQHLSQILTKLEDEIGAKLINRKRSGTTLTPAGSEVIDDIRSINTLASAIATHFRPALGRGSNTLPKQIYCYISSNVNPVFVTDLLVKMRSALPSINVSVEEHSTAETIAAISDNENIIGHVILSEDIPQLKPQIPDTMAVVTATKLSIVMLVAKNSPLAGRYKSISLKQLLAYPLVFYSPYSLSENHLFLLLNTIGVPNVKYCVSNLQAFYRLIENNNCVALGAQGDKIKNSERFVAIPIQNTVQMYSCWVVHKNIKDTEVVRKFFDCYQQLRSAME